MGDANEYGPLPPEDIDVFLVDFPTPSELEQIHGTKEHPLPVYDSAVKWLAGHSHPQQRRQMLHFHQKKMNEFVAASESQWDKGYVQHRFSRSRPKESMYATPEMQRNIEAARPDDGGNIPLCASRGPEEDKLSMNELSFHLSNQAAYLRMTMLDEYEDLRIFQNREIESFLRVKEKKEPLFAKAVEEARTVSSQRRRSSIKSIRRDTFPPAVNAGPPTQPPILQSSSPVLHQSPIEPPDLHHVMKDPSLPPFAKFFVNLEVVQEKWATISPDWNRYVTILRRGLMTETAFAKAIFQDAVRTGTKFLVEIEHIKNTREAAKSIPESMHNARILTDIVLEMAEQGDIEYTTMAVDEDKGVTFGPRILMDAMNLEKKFQTEE